MNLDEIKQLIESRIPNDGLIETGVEGVKLFRAGQAMPCVPAVYEPCIVAIVSGSKEVVLDGSHYHYDRSQYLCCPTAMPLKAGTPNASEQDPLLGVYISLNPRLMGELAMEMESTGRISASADEGISPSAIRLSPWDEEFSDALLRILQLGVDETDIAVLGAARLRELHYAVLKGEAGHFARRAFGVGNAIARAIAHISINLGVPISIEEMATRAGMSRAVFHRKFKRATTMSPIQFVKTMRLNTAGMLIADGMVVNQAALNVGYASPSQFSREFKRAFGRSPKEWVLDQQR